MWDAKLCPKQRESSAAALCSSFNVKTPSSSAASTLIPLAGTIIHNFAVTFSCSVFLCGFCHWIRRLFRPPLWLQMSKATKRVTFSGLSETFLRQSGVKSGMQRPLLSLRVLWLSGPEEVADPLWCWEMHQSAAPTKLGLLVFYFYFFGLNIYFNVLCVFNAFIIKWLFCSNLYEI